MQEQQEFGLKENISIPSKHYIFIDHFTSIEKFACCIVAYDVTDF